jgi:methionyl-tRNA formyltransferase
LTDPLRIVLAAEESAGVQALHALLALPEPPVIPAVLTTPPKQAARRPLVHEAASGLGLPTRPAEAVCEAELGEWLVRERIDLLLNVHSLHVIDPDVVVAPRIGSFNLHPGPLPEYAGLNAPSWAIYNGERTHAVTVHWMDAGVDTGPVAYADTFEIAETETGLSLAGTCVRRGIPLLLRLVSDAKAGGIPRLEQDPERRRWYGRVPPSGGRLDWSCSAAEIARFVRAADYGPYPSPWGPLVAELSGHTVEIVSASLTGRVAVGPPGSIHEQGEGGALVSTADELVEIRYRN